MHIKKVFIRKSYLYIASVFLIISYSCRVPVFEVPPGHKTVSFYHDQHLRSTLFYVPKKLKRKKRSLVLCLHNENETAESMQRITRRSFNRLAEQNGFIIGYPEALNKYWNDGREDSISLSHYNDIDDVGFINRLIDYGIDSFGVEPGHVFVAGFSNGGLMAYRLACALPDRIRGIGAVSASLALDQLVDCDADTTISVIMINGTRDPQMPFDGGEMMVDGLSQGSVLSSEATVQYWLDENDCKEKVSKRDMPNANTLDETRSERFIYSNCAGHEKVMWIKVSNGGHTWPGGRQYRSEKAVGKTSKDFNAAVELWKFFKGL